ncbi:MAG: SRPBCC family protein [Kofleriaceae bacterium]
MSHPIRNRLVGPNIPPIERVATAFLGGLAITAGLRRRSLLGLAAAGVGAIAVLRAITGRCPAYRARAVRKGVHVRRAITVQASPREIYDLWRDLPNLPRFLRHVRSIELEDDGVSRWVIGVRGRELSWRARIVEDTPARRLRWRSLPGGDLRHEGSIELRPAPGDRGTIVEVKLHYFPPGGLVVASALYGFLRKITAVEIGMELARLQQLLETGELATGARRVDELAEHERAYTTTPIAPLRATPITSAQTSGWDGRTTTPGGAR